MREPAPPRRPALVTLIWTHHAARAFDALREPYRTQVDRMLTRFALYGEGDVRPIQGYSGRYRLKSTSHREIYRVSFLFLDDALLIADVERRDKAYRPKH